MLTIVRRQQLTLLPLLPQPDLSSPPSPRTESFKPEVSVSAEEPSSARPRLHTDEALWLEEVPSYFQHGATIEVLMASFLQKRAQKEIPVSNNQPELQLQVDDAKHMEWETLAGKQAVRLWFGADADNIRRKHADRFIGSRFVVTNKKEDDTERIKSPLARALILQVLASKRWVLNLGDIKGAFLEAGPLPQKYRPLYAHQPQGGIPNVTPTAVIEVLGNVYGANDAPAHWHKDKEFDPGSQGWLHTRRFRFLPIPFQVLHRGSHRYHGGSC